MKRYLVTLLLFLLSPWVTANNYMHLSGNLLRFDYQEYLLSGEKFNKETGIIQGFSTGYSYITHNFGFNLTVGYYKGNIDYYGQTQAGVPLNTTTDTSFTDISAELSWYPASNDLGFYTKLQWFEWQRNILPSRQSLELREVYQWQSFEAGFVNTLLKYKKHRIEFKFGLNHSKKGQLKIDLSKVGYGKPHLALGEGSGTSTSLTYHFDISNNKRLSIGLSHRQWKFSQSESKTISGNANHLNIREPRSESQRTNVVINYRLNFDYTKR